MKYFTETPALLRIPEIIPYKLGSSSFIIPLWKDIALTYFYCKEGEIKGFNCDVIDPSLLQNVSEDSFVVKMTCPWKFITEKGYSIKVKHLNKKVETRTIITEEDDEKIIDVFVIFESGKENIIERGTPFMNVTCVEEENKWK